MPPIVPNVDPKQSETVEALHNAVRNDAVATATRRGRKCAVPQFKNILVKWRRWRQICSAFWHMHPTETLKTVEARIIIECRACQSWPVLEAKVESVVEAWISSKKRKEQRDAKAQKELQDAVVRHNLEAERAKAAAEEAAQAEANALAELEKKKGEAEAQQARLDSSRKTRSSLESQKKQAEELKQSQKEEEDGLREARKRKRESAAKQAELASAPPPRAPQPPSES